MTLYRVSANEQLDAWVCSIGRGNPTYFITLRIILFVKRISCVCKVIYLTRFRGKPQEGL